MTIAYRPPASIECEKSTVITRKIIPQRPYKNPYRTRINVALLFPYKFDRNAAEVIEKELNPREHIICPQSMLLKGDGLKGDMMSCILGAPLKKEIVKTASSTHQGNFLETDVFAYVKLEKAFKSIEGMANFPLLAE